VASLGVRRNSGDNNLCRLVGSFLVCNFTRARASASERHCCFLCFGNGKSTFCNYAVMAPQTTSTKNHQFTNYLEPWGSRKSNKKSCKESEGVGRGIGKGEGRFNQVSI
jgi:hypothetical protein